MAFVAGQRLRASQLNDEFARTSYGLVTANISKISDTTLSNATGLSFSLAANSEYLMDGFLTYYGLDGVDMKVAFTGPAGMTVSWGTFGAPIGNTTNVGSMEFGDLEVYGTANIITLNTEDTGASMCTPKGFWRTGGTAGTLQMVFAQNVSNATAVTLVRGSWLRLYKFS